MTDPRPVGLATLRGWPLPEPNASTKQSRGVALVVGGSRETPGAVLLAAEAALRAGCGKVRIATVASTATALAVAVPEARVYALEETPAGHLAAGNGSRLADLAGEADATLVGPGLVDPDLARSLVAAMLARMPTATVTLDALATTWLDDRPRREGPTVVTANPGELEHVLGGEVRDPVEAVAALAAATGATLLLGGDTKLAAGPEGTPYAVTAGGTGLATAGSGDVQAGLVAGLLARGAEPLQAAVWAAWLHATAGDRLAARVGTTGFLARELSSEVPRLLDEAGG